MQLRVEPPVILEDTPSDSPLRVISEIESELGTLDSIQQEIAFQAPDGPQRLRGLAGTGKTVTLAQRAAKIHIEHPDWTIGFVFFTRSLYQDIKGLITDYCDQPGNCKPNWDKLKVRHSWGAVDQDGFYSDLASELSLPRLSVSDVRGQIGSTAPGKAFEYACLKLVQQRIGQDNYSPDQVSDINEIRDLKHQEILTSSDIIQKSLMEAEEKNLELIPKLYDVLIVDEGQDLPPIFYKLLWATLREPKRLYWAYDEAQGIGSLIIPTGEKLFGRKKPKPETPDAAGELWVDLRGSYPGGILKSHRMYRCYRTSRLLLMTAHALSMGLRRQGGALQGVTTRKDWGDLGYTIVSGSFTTEGLPVTITRETDASPHSIDQDIFESKEALGDTLTYRTFDSEDDEQLWVVNQVKNDLKLGFRPEDLLITALGGSQGKDYLNGLKRSLESEGILAYIAGEEKKPGERFPNRSIFRMKGRVTIANIHRAKGNEAWKVYTCRFHCATQPSAEMGEKEIHKRNEAFVALTRARVWCVVTGLNNPIFDELEEVISMVRNEPPNLTFPAFNKNSLKRITEDEE